MKSGKDCVRTTFVANKNYQSYGALYRDLTEQGIETLEDLLDATHLVGFSRSDSTQKGVHTFSPFVEVKPIKEPTKWKTSHLAKAILSGQVFHGIIEGRYSDDYARDAEQNFGKGAPVDLPGVARELIEDSSRGIHISVSESKNGLTELSMATYSFDYKRFSFDVNCNHALKQERLEIREQELEQTNRAQEQRAFSIQPEDINPDEIYQVTYLEKDRNTQGYKEISQWMFPKE